MANIIEFRPPKKRQGPVRGSTDPLKSVSLGKLTKTGFKESVLSAQGVSVPTIIVKPFGGAFSATFLQRRDGSEHRLQIFPDPWAASRCARLLNAALAEGCR